MKKILWRIIMWIISDKLKKIMFLEIQDYFETFVYDRVWSSHDMSSALWEMYSDYKINEFRKELLKDKYELRLEKDATMHRFIIYKGKKMIFKSRGKIIDWDWIDRTIREIKDEWWVEKDIVKKYKS